MKFSVLLSVYHKEIPANFKLALESIWEHQSLKPTEIVLVKDGPLGDNLEEVIADFQKKAPLKVIGLEKNLGLGKALNIGLAECSYDIVARMDTDDIAFPDRFKKQMNIFQQNSEIDLVSSWITEFNDNIDNIKAVRRLPENHQDLLIFAKNRCPVNHPVVMFRKKSVLDVGGYKHFPLFEDYFLWVRMLMNNSQFYTIQESLLYFRVDNNMYKRRGGLQHAKDDFKLQKYFLHSGFISIGGFIHNVITRCSVRLFPNSLRRVVYNTFLR